MAKTQNEIYQREVYMKRVTLIKRKNVKIMALITESLKVKFEIVTVNKKFTFKNLEKATEKFKKILEAL